MKNLTVIIALSLALISCKKQSNTPASTNNTTPPSSTSTLTITVNNPTITAGQSVVLTASGATTYTWSTGVTTNSITVSPTSTTSYTVTGTTGSNTGTATAVVTVSTGTTTATDSVWIDVLIEAPQSTTFSYHYDTTNTRILINGHRLAPSVFNIYYDYPTYGSPIKRFSNFIHTVGQNEHDTPILMNSGDTLTFEIDRHYYSIVDGNRGGHLFLGVNTKPNTLNNTVNNTIFSLSSDSSGTSMGNAPTNGMGGTTQTFYWYLGWKYTYKWIKP